MDSDDDRDDRDDLAAGEPPAIDPYAVLGLDRDDAAAITAEQIRSAYRKAALRCHPDKVAAERRTTAHAEFQEVAFAYAVLSDPARRKRYDETGSTAASVVDGDGFSWSDFYRAAFADAVSADAIAAFAAQYKNSDEERADVLAAYDRHRGDMDGVYESVMLSDVQADDARFRAIIDEAVAAGTVPKHARYARETAASKRARRAAAARESREAEAYAKELGVHDKLFGGGGGSGGDDDDDDDDDGSSSKAAASKKGGGRAKTAKTAKTAEASKISKTSKKIKAADDQAGLAALIQKRQQDRAASFLDNLAAKYGATAPAKKSAKGGKGGKGSKKRRADEEDVPEEEPSEEAFQAAAARLKNGKKTRR